MRLIKKKKMKKLCKKSSVVSKKKLSNDVASLPNIGKVIAKNLEKIGIVSAEEFLSRDPYDIFDELLDVVDPTLCRCALASIVGAHRGVKWHTVTKQAAKEFDKRYPQHSWKTKC